MAASTAGHMQRWISLSVWCQTLRVGLHLGFSIEGSSPVLLRKWPSHLLFSTYLIALVAAFLVLRKYDLVTANLPEFWQCTL